MPRFFYTIFLCLLLILGLSVSGCTKSEQQTPVQNKPGQVPTQVTTEVKIADFYPQVKDSTWKYQGEGNEYASFTRKVLYNKGNLAQFREDNGGTVSASVILVSSDAVTRTFFLGEAYEDTNYLDKAANDNLVILKAPLKKGTVWKNKSETREIVDTDAQIATLAGTFSKCLKVKIAHEQSITYEYFHAGIGLVHREFIAGESKVSSSLQNYTIPK